MRILFILITACLVLATCSRQEEAPASGADGAAGWATTRDALIEEYLKAQPAFAVYQGRHEFDGRLPDWSAQALAAEVKRLRAARERAAAVTGLTAVDAFERDYLVSQFEDDLFFLEDAQSPFVNPAFYIGSLDPGAYLTRNYAPLETRMRAYIAYAKAIPQAAQQIRANLRTPLSLPLLERGLSGFRGYAEFYREDVSKAFADVPDAALQKELAAANEAAAQAMSDLADWLESQQEDGNGGLRAGCGEVCAHDPDHRGRDNAARRSRSRRPRGYGAKSRRPGVSLRDVRARGVADQACIVKATANKPDGGAVAGARAQLDTLKKFVQNAGVATIPGTEQALVDTSPPYNAANFAYIDIPDRTRKGCRRSTTSPRPTRPGRRPNSASTCPDGRTCSLPRSTRSGPGTSSSSCTRTATRRSSDGCSSATRSPKGGPTT